MMLFICWEASSISFVLFILRVDDVVVIDSIIVFESSQ